MDLQRGVLALAMAAILTPHVAPALAASASEIDQKATAALKKLYATTPEAKTLGNKAKGISAMLHTAEFDVDEESLVIGVKVMTSVLLDYLARHSGGK